MRRTILVVVLAVATAAAVAQNLAYRQDPDWQAPPDAASKPNPLSGRPELAAGGRKLYKRHCATCHDEDGKGIKNAADLQLDVVQQQSDGSLYWKITNGNSRRGMPSFSSIPEMQRWQIVLHLRALANPEAPTQ